MDKKYILKNSIKCQNVFSGVYFLIRKNDIIYIGSANDVMGRIKTHKLNRRMRFTHYFALASEINEARKTEQMYIKKFRPLFNFKCNPDFDSGKKKVLHAYLTKFKSYKEIRKGTGYRENIIGDVIFKRGNVSIDVINTIEDFILKK